MQNLIEKLRNIRLALDNLLIECEKQVFTDTPATPETPEIGTRPDVTTTNQKLVWIPFAEITDKKIKTQGKYLKGYPEGAIIHYNSGRFLAGDKDALSCVSYLAKDDPENKKWPYPCLVISTTGKIFQAFPISEWGYHCGTSHHKTHIGIEIMSAGDVKKVAPGKYESWFKETYSEDEVRFCDGSDDRPKGYYTKATEQQEAALLRLLVWLKTNNKEVFNFNNIKGHSHVLPASKKDVGGTLSMPISALIEKCKLEYQKTL